MTAGISLSKLLREKSLLFQWMILTSVGRSWAFTPRKSCLEATLVSQGAQLVVGTASNLLLGKALGLVGQPSGHWVPGQAPGQGFGAGEGLLLAVEAGLAGACSVRLAWDSRSNPSHQSLDFLSPTGSQHWEEGGSGQSRNVNA